MSSVVTNRHTHNIVFSPIHGPVSAIPKAFKRYRAEDYFLSITQILGEKAIYGWARTMRISFEIE